MKNLKQWKKNLERVLFFLMLSNVALATTSDAPWDKMLTKVIGYLTGSTARLFAIIVLVFVGYKVIWGNAMEGGGFFMKVVIGLSIIFSAVSWGPYFFGYSGSILM